MQDLINIISHCRNVITELIYHMTNLLLLLCMEICYIVLRKWIILLVLLFYFPNSISTYTTVKMIPTESIMMHTDCICNPHIVTKTHILMIGFTSQLLQITQHSMDWNQPQTMLISILPDDLLTEQNNILGPLILGCSIHKSYSF